MGLRKILHTLWGSVITAGVIGGIITMVLVYFNGTHIIGIVGVQLYSSMFLYGFIVTAATQLILRLTKVS